MLTVAIQAGGQSRRMGADKGLMPLRGMPLIEHLISRVSGLGDELLITTNNPSGYAYLGLPMASDPSPGGGALVGLHTALSAAHGEQVLVLACDMPFVQRPLLMHLLTLSSEADIVIPRRAGEFEPLHAVYARSCLSAVQEALEGGEKRTIGFFPRVRVLPVEEDELRRFDPHGLSFFNINTPQDLAQAERTLDGGPWKTDDGR